MDIFWVFAKIGAFTLGGGYAMIPLIQEEMRKKRWISEEELPDIIALAQSAPGILAVNVAVFTGHRLRNLKGSIVAAIGCVIPSFIIILCVALAFRTFKENTIIEKIFKGIRPAVIALIAVPAIRMAGNLHKLKNVIIFLFVPILVVVFRISPIYVLLSILIISVVYLIFIKRIVKK